MTCRRITLRAAVVQLATSLLGPRWQFWWARSPGRRPGGSCSRRFAARSSEVEPLEERILLASVTLVPSKDNTLFEDAAGGLSSGQGEFLFSGVQNRGLVRRTVLAFDVSAVDIPAGSVIDDVSLELAVASSNSASDHDFALYQLTQDWGEGTSSSIGGTGAGAAAGDATWLHTFHDAAVWTNPGGDTRSTPSATSSVAGAGTTARWSSASMVADVAAWLADPATNFGWLLRSDESHGNVRKFVSKDNPSPAKPKLIIDYTPADGLILEISATSVSEGRGAAAVTGTVRRQSDATDALVVTLTSSDTSEATVAETVTIPAGQRTSPPFTIDAVDDGLVDATQAVTIRATAAGQTYDVARLQVTDNDTTRVRLDGALLRIEDQSDAGAGDQRTLALQNSELVIRNPGNTIASEIPAASGNGSSEVRIPLETFSSGIVVETALGDDAVILDGSLSSSLVAGLEFDGGAGHDSLRLKGAGVELQLSQFDDYERIDVAGSGSNTLVIDLASAQANANGSDPLVIKADGDDRLTFDQGWQITQTLAVGQELFRVIGRAGVELHVAGPLDWQNPLLPMDVSGDGVVSPRDPLLIINELNRPRYSHNGALVDAASLQPFPFSFFDVLGNGQATHTDAVNIIDFLNEQVRTGAPPGDTVPSTTTVRVSVTRRDNLQWLNFWVAQGAGLFADEGIEVAVASGNVGTALGEDVADVAVMPRPTFLTQVGQQRPVLAFANLLAHDPINLVVRREVAEQRGLSIEMPLADRLQAMQGLRIGVAPGPPPRLEFLFESVGLDVNQHAEVVIVSGPDQNSDFASGAIDALYAHTPFLETALVDQDAVMIVNQSAGEVPGLANRQIHMLVTSEDYAAANPEVITAMARAIYRAQLLIHEDRQAAIRALRKSVVDLQAPHALDTIVRIYQPAVPRTPEVSDAGVLRELELFPGRNPPPDLSGIDISTFIDNRFAQAAVSEVAGEIRSD